MSDKEKAKDTPVVKPDPKKQMVEIYHELKKLGLTWKAAGSATGYDEKSLSNAKSKPLASPKMISDLRLYVDAQKAVHSMFQDLGKNENEQVMERGVSYLSLHQLRMEIRKNNELLATLLESQPKKETAEQEESNQKKKLKKQNTSNYPNSQGVHEPSPSTNYLAKKNKKASPKGKGAQFPPSKGDPAK